MSQDGGKQAGPDSQEHNPQEMSSQDDGTRSDDQAAELFQQETYSSTTPTAGNHKASREDRVQKPHGWFKEQHPVPPAGDPNRQHLYAHNRPISDDEFAETLQAFNNSTTNAETGARDSLATRQRLRTPPIERARKQVQSLEEQGVQLTDDLEKEIIDNMIHNMGLVPALAEWCKNEADIPVKYANELLKEIDRLKLEMAKQQRDLHEKIASQMKTIEDYQAQKKGREKAEQEIERSQDNREKKKKMLDEQVKRTEKKKKELDKKADANDKLEGLDDSSIPSSEPSVAIPRTPPGTEGLTPASSCSMLVEVGEGKGLQQQVSDLQPKLDEARKDNERLRESNGSVSVKDSTNSRPDTENKINTLEKENEDLKAKLEGQMKEMNQLNQKIAKLQQIEGDQDRSEEMEASDTDAEKSSSERVEYLEKELEQKTREGNRKADKNQVLTSRIAELQIRMRHFHRQAEGKLTRLEELERVNFPTADRLVEAISSENEEFNGKNGLSLVDKINYLNMATFIRTCNYMQLAIRENSDSLAKILMNDAKNWFQFCQEDLAKMDPSVGIQMEASMHILEGARRALITKNKEVTKAGRTSIRRGIHYLNQYPEGPAFGQLRRLAYNVLERTNNEQSMFKKVLKPSAIARKRVQDRIRNDPIMKASELRRPGLHSPLSPSQWGIGNLDEEIPIEEDN
ncbi:hypothetical protein NW768_009375 [Fusarium equiseti]|uniref:Uncharacterized protein n=1 Tax=Fusarium equiseti TaxID=61235 RepID=A0ABQ8R3W0_FUSEQ|nr:hypothetical protein NW768_009375 [Fusarium equiseti]